MPSNFIASATDANFSSIVMSRVLVDPAVLIVPTSRQNNFLSQSRRISESNIQVSRREAAALELQTTIRKPDVWSPQIS